MKITIDIGSVFCIPLFMDKSDWKLKSKLSDTDLDKDFAFGRVMNTSSSVLVEIFRVIGPANMNISVITNSGIMFSPVKIFWDGIIKKRWRIIGQTDNYDKYKDSNYSNLKMAFGLDNNIRLRNMATEVEIPITREEMKNYEYASVWFPIDLEIRILTYLNKNGIV